MGPKNVFILIIMTCFMANTIATRELPIEPGFKLAAPLEANGGKMECWNVLVELKSCTNEIVLFFLGQTGIGPGCCQAITMITRDCWPAMCSSLGFTAEEANILQGYCNASSAPAGSPLAASPA